jgi:hypothetical protein
LGVVEPSSWLEDALTPMRFDLLLGEDIFLVHWISYFRTGLIRLLCGIIYCINNVWHDDTTKGNRRRRGRETKTPLYTIGGRGNDFISKIRFDRVSGLPIAAGPALLFHVHACRRNISAVGPMSVRRTPAGPPRTTSSFSTDHHRPAPSTAMRGHFPELHSNATVFAVLIYVRVCCYGEYCAMS